MGYGLGVDLGTTWSAAAVAWPGAEPQVIALGGRTAAVPTVVHVLADGSANVGDAAERRAITEPDRVTREFKRRIGDTTPVLLGGQPWSPESLLVTVLRWVLSRVSELEGSPPESIVVTHPANWGPLRRELLEQAIGHAGIQARMVTEPEAAAIHYASAARVPDGTVVAVYDLGGGTFDATVLRKTGSGFEVLGRPEGVERLGGLDFDAAVVAHITESLGSAWTSLDATDPSTAAAVSRLRADCVLAKEALSEDPDATISVQLPTVATEVRLTRGELEAMIRPSIELSADALARAMAGAGLSPAQVDRILLVGGSSRIPLVSQVLTSRFGRPLALDTHPKHAVALGAARLAVGAAVAGGAPTAAPSVAPLAPTAPPTVPIPPPTVPIPPVPTPSPSPTVPVAAFAPPPVASPPVAPPPTSGPTAPVGGPQPAAAASPRRKVPVWVPVVAVLVVLALIAGLLLAGGGDDGGDDPGGGGSGDEVADGPSDDFCSLLEGLSGEVSDGGLESSDGPQAIVDTVGELDDETSNDDEASAVNEVADTLENEGDDPDATLGAIQDELGGFADDCGIDEFAVPPDDGGGSLDGDATGLAGVWFYNGFATECFGLSDVDCDALFGDFTSEIRIECDEDSSCFAAIASADVEFLSPTESGGFFASGVLPDADGFQCDGGPDPTTWQLEIESVTFDGDGFAESFDGVISLRSEDTAVDGLSCVEEFVAASGTATPRDGGEVGGVEVRTPTGASGAGGELLPFDVVESQAVPGEIQSFVAIGAGATAFIGAQTLGEDDLVVTILDVVTGEELASNDDREGAGCCDPEVEVFLEDGQQVTVDISELGGDGVDAYVVYYETG